MTLSVTIFIPVYNSAADLEQVLRECVRLDYPNLKVFALDDASSDQSPEILERLAAEFPSIISWARNEQNLGLARSFNRVFDLLDSDIVLMLHADCVPCGPELVCALVRPMEDPRVAAVAAPWVVTGDQACAVDDVYARVIRLNYELQDLATITPGPVDVVDERCVMFRREAVLAVGGFRPVHKACGEGIDMSWRLRRAGYRLIMINDAFAYHLFSTHHSGLRPNLVKSILYARIDAVLHSMYPREVPVRHHLFVMVPGFVGLLALTGLVPVVGLVPLTSALVASGIALNRGTALYFARQWLGLGAVAIGAIAVIDPVWLAHAGFEGRVLLALGLGGLGATAHWLARVLRRYVRRPSVGPSRLATAAWLVPLDYTLQAYGSIVGLIESALLRRRQPSIVVESARE